jgi:parallel beta-helix repeat protein
VLRKWITIKAVNKWGPKIETSGNTYCFTVHNSSYIAVDGFEFTQESALANRSTGYGFLQTEGHHITVRNCHAHHCGGNGIAMAYGDYFTAENNLVHHNAYWDPMQTSGISVYEPVASDNAAGFHIIIRGNVSYSNENKVPSPAGEYTDGNGIIMDDFLGTQGNSGHGAYAPESLVENNICYDNGRKGIHSFSSQNITVRNNTCYWNNRAVKDTYGWNPELSNSWSRNNAWENNIGVANTSYHSSNVALGDMCWEANYNRGTTWKGNVTWNGKAGNKSILQVTTSADMSNNLLGIDPLFVNAPAGDFSLKPGSGKRRDGNSKRNGPRTKTRPS